LGIGFVPEDFLKSEKDIRIINLIEPLATRDIVLVRKKGHTLPMPARKLLELIKEDYTVSNKNTK